MHATQNTDAARVTGAEKSAPALHSVKGGHALVNSAGQPGDECAEVGELCDAGTITHGNPLRLNHLRMLEAESIHIFREVACEFQRPVMLYSIGKDSSVLLRLAQKAFYPGRIPFPLLQAYTSYKFRERREFRDSYTRQLGIELFVHRNEEDLADE